MPDSRPVRRSKKPKAYPKVVVALYGPNGNFASRVKVVVRSSGRTREERNWYSDEIDVRQDPVILAEVWSFMHSHGEPQDTFVTAGVLGCPHVEGVDFSKGGRCEKCRWWIGRELGTQEVIH